VTKKPNKAPAEVPVESVLVTELSQARADVAALQVPLEDLSRRLARLQQRLSSAGLK
jgi:hypothetical protein